MKKISSSFRYRILLIIILFASILFLPKVVAAAGKNVYVFDQAGEWSTTSVLNIFQTDSHANEKLLAPGSNGSYLFTVKNGLDEGADYRLTLSNINQAKIPLLVRVRTTAGQWLIGGEDQWETSDAFPLFYKNKLSAKAETQFEIEWLWKLEDNRDGLDTQLGDQAVQERKNYQLNLEIYAEAADSPTDNSVGKNNKGSQFLPKTGEDINEVYSLIGLLIISLISIRMSCRKKYQS